MRGLSMDNILNETEIRMQSAIDNMEKRFNNIRAGRANPAILDGILVNYYGVDTPLKQLATISIPEARQLQIKPYDKSTLGIMEKAIFEANIGLTPNNNGEVIILNIPALTEDTRKDYVKQAKTISEECKIALRNIRQDSNNDIKKADLTEDEIKVGQEEVQELINKYNKIVDEKIKIKETELMTV
jgi:ribosome recycling factor